MCDDERMVPWGVNISKCQWTINQFKPDTMSTISNFSFLADLCIHKRLSECSPLKADRLLLNISHFLSLTPCMCIPFRFPISPLA